MNNEDMFYKAALTKRLARNERAKLYIKLRGNGTDSQMAWQIVAMSDECNRLENEADVWDAKAKAVYYPDVPSPQTNA